LRVPDRALKAGATGDGDGREETFYIGSPRHSRRVLPLGLANREPPGTLVGKRIKLMPARAIPSGWGGR